MKEAANLHDLKLGTLLPGITINTGANDFYPIEQMQMQRFDGERWVALGPIMNGTLGS
jgi:branched-chain amino acid transport system substrate-binding protein